MGIFSVYPMVMLTAIGVCTIFAVWMLMRYHIIGGDTGTSAAKKENEAYEKLQKQVKYKTWLLKQCENFANAVGGGISEKERFEWDYRIMRAFPEIQLLNRKMKSIELIGLMRMISFVCVAIACLALIWGNGITAVIFIILCFLIPSAVKMAVEMLINSKDKELEHDFPSLYLMLYCRLIRGVNARLAPTLTDYMRSMDAVYLPNEHKEIREFVMDLRNNIEVYSDESEAVKNLKNKYRSAMMMNFANLAMQALRGTDNRDTLLSFKTDLANREAQQMLAEATKRAEKAKMAVNVVFVILFEFIMVSIASKMPSMSSLFSMLG